MSSEPEPDLIEPEGVNAGSSGAERDREPSRSAPVEHAVGAPELDAPPADGELAGAPGQRDDVPGQQYAVGEG